MASLGFCVSADFFVYVTLHPVLIPEAQSPLARLYVVGDSVPQETVPSGIWAHSIGKAAMAF